MGQRQISTKAAEHENRFDFNKIARVLLSDDGKAANISDVPEFNSEQQETDTCIIIYCPYALAKVYKYVKICTPDSDIYWILLHYATSFSRLTIFLETDTGNNQMFFGYDMTLPTRVGVNSIFSFQFQLQFHSFQLQLQL